MTPLHQAVIDDNFSVFENRAIIDKWRNVPDNLGFTALEIAKYLGKYQAVELLGGRLPNVFKLQPNGAKLPLELSRSGFEKALGFQYCPYPIFSSYAFFKDVINQCPFILRSHSLASDNYEWGKLYREEILEGKTASAVIKWIDPILGYGAFAAEDLQKGQFVVEYAGAIRQLSRRHPDQNPYCFHYPTKWWSLKYLTIDAMKEGNLSRFINHSTHANLQPLCVVDRKLLHLIFVAKHAIPQGKQLTLDYGDDYWIKRHKVANF